MSAATTRNLSTGEPRQAALDAARALRDARGDTNPEPTQDTSHITMATITPIFGRKEAK